MSGVSTGPESAGHELDQGTVTSDVIAAHFAAENAHDIAAILATYTDDVVWDDVANPACPVRGKQAAAGMCEGIMAAIPDLQLESIVRFETGAHAVDESVAAVPADATALVEAAGSPEPV